MPGFNDFLSRIQTDYTFYLQFRQNPRETLASYELSAEEQMALTESGASLWDRLGTRLLTFNMTTNVVAFGSADAAFDPTAPLSRPEIQRTIAQIRGAGTHVDRSTAVLALIEQIG